MAQATAKIWFGILWNGPFNEEVPSPLTGRPWNEIVDALHPRVEVVVYGELEEDDDRMGFATPASTLEVSTGEKDVLPFLPMTLLTHPTHTWEEELRKVLAELGWKDPPKAEWHLSVRLSW